MEPRKHTVHSTEQVSCPVTGKREALLPGDTCNGCQTDLTADNANQYGVLTISKSLGSMLGL